MKKKHGVIVSRKELAELLGVGLTTIDAWCERGCPGRKGGKGCRSEFNTAKVFHWILNTRGGYVL